MNTTYKEFNFEFNEPLQFHISLCAKKLFHTINYTDKYPYCNSHNEGRNSIIVLF